MNNAEPVFVDITKGEYKRGIFNAIIAPRPIGWMSTVDASGNANLAPFSYFNIVANDPPVLVFSCNTPEDRDLKDTLKNVQSTGEFVFNLASHELVEEMNMSSFPLPAGQDEFEYAKLEKASCIHVKAPRVARSPVSLECKLIETVVLEGDGTKVTVNFGQVVGMHIDAGFLTDDGHFDTAKAQPVARLGGPDYAVSAPSFTLTRQFVRANEDNY